MHTAAPLTSYTPSHSLTAYAELKKEMRKLKGELKDESAAVEAARDPVVDRTPSGLEVSGSQPKRQVNDVRPGSEL